MNRARYQMYPARMQGDAALRCFSASPSWRFLQAGRDGPGAALLAGMSKHILPPARESQLRDELLFVFLINLRGYLAPSLLRELLNLSAQAALWQPWGCHVLTVQGHQLGEVNPKPLGAGGCVTWSSLSPSWVRMLEFRSYSTSTAKLTITFPLFPLDSCCFLHPTFPAQVSFPPLLFFNSCGVSQAVCQVAAACSVQRLFPIIWQSRFLRTQEGQGTFIFLKKPTGGWELLVKTVL